MPLVTISVVGTNIATQSDELGNYKLILPYTDTTIELQFAYIGYESVKQYIGIKENEQKRVDVAFTKKNVNIKEVIVLSQEERTSTITKN